MTLQSNGLLYMLDTDPCIYVMKNRPIQAQKNFLRHEYRLCISTIVMMELLTGAEKSAYPEKNINAIYDFTSHFPIIDYDIQAALHTAQIKVSLEKAGTPIGAYDVMIAGHARSLGLVVVTNNEREFRRVEGLRVENWSVAN